MGEDLPRLRTGVAGLDSLLDGGYPARSTILVSGYPGTGKTLLTSHFLHEGVKSGSNGIYVSFEASKSEFYEQTGSFGFNFEELEERGSFRCLMAIPHRFFVSPSTFDIQNTVQGIEEARAAIDAERLVIDSISALMVLFESSYQARKSLYILNSRLKEMGMASMFISEAGPRSEFSNFGVEEYIADGVVHLTLEEVQERKFQRFLRVVKMRKTAHKMEKYPLQIGSNGMEVLVKG
jgi:KaiC/GvpD/RAD55 family RecA-like ATPase